MVYAIEMLAITAAHGVARARVNSLINLPKRSPKASLQAVNITQQLGALPGQFPDLGKGVADLALVVWRSLQAAGGWLILNPIDELAQDFREDPHTVACFDGRDDRLTLFRGEFRPVDKITLGAVIWVLTR
jgi:hypothetical protein